MINYVLPQNPDDRILKRAKDLLSEGRLVVFPTDTSWVVVCDPFSKVGVENLYRFKGEEKSKHFSLLCDHISRASDYAFISDQAYRLLKSKIPGHYTFIFQARKKITKALKASKTDKEIGIRFSPCVFTRKFLEFYNGVLLSTNLLPEMVDVTDNSEIYGSMIEESNISFRLGMILDPGEYDFVGPSTMIDFSNEGEVHLLRDGVGPSEPFVV